MADNSKFVPPNGMRDWLPMAVLLRQKLIRLIESQYQLYGFLPIDTPVMENIEVLQGKGGGENEKLMFSVIKRGKDFYTACSRFYFPKHSPPEGQIGYPNQLDVEEMGRFKNDLTDIGLRYDLTVPLARYVGNYFNALPKPFRCYHIGPVWRADRPQRGRFREFYQCDIDIVGGVFDDYEVELLLATDRVLKALNVGKFKIRISHKNFLPKWFESLGVPKDVIPKVAVIFDKVDKADIAELTKALNVLKLETGVESKLTDLLVDAINKKSDFNFNDSTEMNALKKEALSISDRVLAINSDANVVFDPFLVRGFDYYTGPVFEINVEDKDFTFSIGGGGRYDGLIEKLGGPKNTPAVGLSLGFERILTILMEREMLVKIPMQQRVYIVNDGKSEKDIQVLAETLRSQGIAVETGLEKKDKVKQLVAAQGSGLEYAITDFVPGAATFKVRQLSNRKDIEMNAEQLKAVLSKLL